MKHATTRLEERTEAVTYMAPLLCERIKLAGHKRDIPYQSLIKAWLAERIEAERH
jgi:hypothetical protein